MSEAWAVFTLGVVSLAAIPIAYVTMRARWERVEPQAALIVSDPRGVRVALRSRPCWPSQRSFRVDLRPQDCEVSLRGDAAVQAKDGARVDVVARMTLRIPRRKAEVMRVIDRVGCERASDAKVVDQLSMAALDRALRSVAASFSGEEIFARAADFRARVAELLALELEGYSLDGLELATFQRIGARDSAPRTS